MQAEPRKAGTISETREGQFVCSNGGETAKRDWQRLPVKQRDAEQCQGKKNEIERNSEDQNGFSQCGLDPYTLACRFRRSRHLNGRRQDSTDPTHPLLRCMRDSSRVRFI